MENMSNEARELRNKYLREWRAKNKEKVKKHHYNYWERKAKDEQTENK